MHIKTNNQSRPVIYGCELSDKEKSEFDYYSPEELDSREFFRYKNSVYDFSAFMSIDKQTKSNAQSNGLSEWDGYMSDSCFSGIVIRYDRSEGYPDYERVIVGTYYY